MSGKDFYEALFATAPELARRIAFLTGGASTAAGAAFFRWRCRFARRRAWRGRKTRGPMMSRRHQGQTIS